MEMKVKRIGKQSKCTIGELSFHSDFLCNTLELPMPKDGNYTHGFCIAPGRYRVELVMSPHFKFWVPRLIDVPGRDLIEMHPGNSDKDTHGCILTGMDTIKMDWIENSVGEFNAMIDILIKADNRGEELWITIEEEI